MEELSNEIVSRIRSCLISTKGHVSLRQLESDYRTLMGERIPYTKLGFRNLEDFINSAPSLVMKNGPGGEILVDAQVSDKSAHIATMVRTQKPGKTKRKVVRITPRFNRTHVPYQQSYSQPPVLMNKWRPQKAVVLPSINSFPHSPKLTHRQFVSTYPKPTVPSKIVVPPRRTDPPESPPKEIQTYPSATEVVTVSDISGASNGNGVEVRSNEEASRESSSPLTSARKRISRLMSEITLDRDSGNSSPTAEFSINYKSFNQEFVKTGDAITDLKNFAAYYKLGDVVVNFTETKTKKSNYAMCHCKIKVGTHIYSSYPNDFRDKETAERAASQKALEDLMQKYNRRKSLLISSNEDIIERIPPMLEKHQSAVWMWQIEADYIDTYNEHLTSDWLQVIDSSPHVSIEKYFGGYVLKYCNPDDVLQKGKKLDVSLSFGDVSVPSNTVQFDDNNRLYAMVTAAVSVYEIWCQHCQSPEFERFVEMTERMENYYSNHKDELIPKKINFGSCYAVYQDSNWLRVRAVSMPHEGVVDCLLIDYGEESRVPIGNVYSLKREFAHEQAQAFVCSLDGLEELYDASVESEHLTNLVGKEFFLEMVAGEHGDHNGFPIPVVIYNLSGTSVNEELISLLTIESAMPTLDQNSVTEVYVSNIESNGDVYVQVRTPGYYRLLDLLQHLESNILKDPPLHIRHPVTKSNSEGKLYLVKCKKAAKSWLRASIVDWSPHGDLAQIYFVDYGNTDVINVASEIMYPLDKLDDVVSQYPGQAKKVRIMIERIPEDFVERASSLMPQDQTILLKIVSYDNEEVAWVEFFKRSSDGGLFCINKSISVEAELKTIDGQNNNEINSRQRLINLAQFNEGIKNVPSGGSLKKPDLPKKGDYFNVNVPFSVNPWNFFVQPLDSFDQLATLMSEMQAKYKEFHYTPLQIEDIIPGKIYASKHDDGLWYRTSVLKVINTGSISVFYCDFGYYTNLRVDQLVPLDLKFMNLPYQALKGKIAGIKPIKNKWTMEDCEIFNNLVVKKQFVSILVNIEKDELYKSDIILQLLLVDTSSDEDVNIKDILIEKGIATSVQES